MNIVSVNVAKRRQRVSREEPDDHIIGVMAINDQQKKHRVHQHHSQYNASDFERPVVVHEEDDGDAASVSREIEVVCLQIADKNRRHSGTFENEKWRHGPVREVHADSSYRVEDSNWVETFEVFPRE